MEPSGRVTLAASSNPDDKCILLLHRALDGDACCPHEGGCLPQLLQFAIELVPQ